MTQQNDTSPLTSFKVQHLFETIKIKDGKIFNLQWHNQRLNRSRLELFQEKKLLDLNNYLQAPQIGLFRCRVLYSKKIEKIQYLPYTPKIFQNFKIVQSRLQYNHKFNDRSQINQLLEPSYDEIIIEKEGFLTDTSIANIAFLDGKDWITPKVPLLQGTTRAKLLEEKFLKLENIKKENIKNYSHFALMNAMIGFQIQKSINIRL